MKSLRIYLDHKNAQICDKWIPFTVSKIDIIKNLKENQAIIKDDEVVAFFTKNTQEEVDFAFFNIC